MTTKYFLGCDVSLRSGGYAIIKLEDGVPSLVKKTTIKTTSKQTDGEALRKIYDELSDFTEGFTFETVIRERGFSRFNLSTQQIFKSLGVVHLLLDDYDIEEITPTTIKKVIAGHGKSEKQEVLNGIALRLDLEEDDFYELPKTSRGKKKLKDDESDAIAVVLTYLIQEGMI